MELKQLEYFVAAADELNFTRAARRLHVVQSAISTSVRQLEAELGTALFERTTRRMHLTPAGTDLLERARAILGLVDEARAAASPSRELRGAVSLGVIQGAWTGMGESIRAMRAAHPLVALRLRQAPVATILDDVDRGRLDLGVVPLPPDARPGRSHGLHREPMMLVTAEDDELEGPVRIAELDGRDFVDVAPEWALRRVVDDAFAAAGAQRTTTCEVNDLGVAAELVASGLGLMIVPERMVDGRPGLRRIALADAPEWRIGVVTGPRVTAAARALLETITGGSGAPGV